MALALFGLKLSAQAARAAAEKVARLMNVAGQAQEAAQWRGPVFLPPHYRLL